MEQLKVVITDYEYDNVDLERRILEGSGIQVQDCQCKTQDELIAATRDKDGIIVQYCRITAEVIEQLERCKIIIKYGIGVDNIDVAAATAKGIWVCNVPDYGVEEVANHTMAFLLSLARKLPEQCRCVEHGGWGYGDVQPIARLSTCTLGLIGFGRIPQQVCARAKAFDMRVMVYDPYADSRRIQQAGAEPVTLEQLLEQSDYVSCHCPLTKETHHLINRGAMEKMKPGACLINTARGGILQEEDLLWALQEGHLGGAALDVFEQEPLPADSRLRHTPSVIATGHAAWYSEGALEACQRKAAEEVAWVLTGNPPRNPVNSIAFKA